MYTVPSGASVLRWLVQIKIINTAWDAGVFLIELIIYFTCYLRNFIFSLKQNIYFTFLKKQFSPQSWIQNKA